VFVRNLGIVIMTIPGRSLLESRAGASDREGREVCARIIVLARHMPSELCQ
jgi:hypothetical protein